MLWTHVITTKSKNSCAPHTYITFSCVCTILTLCSCLMVAQKTKTKRKGAERYAVATPFMLILLIPIKDRVFSSSGMPAYAQNRSSYLSGNDCKCLEWMEFFPLLECLHMLRMDRVTFPGMAACTRRIEFFLFGNVCLSPKCLHMLRMDRVSSSGMPVYI